MKPAEWHQRVARVSGRISLQIARSRASLSDLNSWADELTLVAKDIRRFAEKFKNSGEKKDEG